MNRRLKVDGQEEAFCSQRYWRGQRPDAGASSPFQKPREQERERLGANGETGDGSLDRS